MDKKPTDEASHKSEIPAELTAITDFLFEYFTDTPDLIVRKLTIKQTGERALLIYLDGLADKNSINNDVLRPLQFESNPHAQDGEWMTNIGHISTVCQWDKMTSSILHGSSMLFIEGKKEAYALDTKGWPQRPIEDPEMESSLKGAHQGFVETGGQNIALIRRYIPNRELKIKRLVVGSRGETIISILYLEDVTNEQFLQRLIERIEQIDIDVIINTGELEELIEDSPFSLFPQFLTTERPDAAASQILQGRCVIVVDRSPSALVAPATFMSFFQTVDDYSTRWSIATFIRFLRIFAFFVAAFLPAFYIAVVSYHFEIIPLRLLLTLGESRGKVPFPPFVEAILMEVTLEMLREAGVRLPAPVGQTVGIVGGIVIGQAVVQAGLISDIMVIVVAFTAIASFIIPNYDMVAAVRIIRFMLMALSAMFGFVGLVVGLMVMIAHLLQLQSLGMPYGSPLSPVRFSDWKDTITRLPLWLMNKRPVSTAAKQSIRQGTTRLKEDQD